MLVGSPAVLEQVELEKDLLLMDTQPVTQLPQQ